MRAARLAGWRRFAERPHGGQPAAIPGGDSPAIPAFARAAASDGILHLFKVTESWQQNPGQGLRYQCVTELRETLSDATAARLPAQ